MQIQIVSQLIVKALGTILGSPEHELALRQARNDLNEAIRHINQSIAKLEKRQDISS